MPLSLLPQTPPFPRRQRPRTNIRRSRDAHRSSPPLSSPVCHCRAYGKLAPRQLAAPVGPLAVVVIAGVLGATLSACSTAPPAAMVNGQVITQTELSQNLQWWSSSPAYVASFDQASKAQSTAVRRSR